MRIQSSVTSLSWIPSEAIPGVTKLPFTLGINHYDAPPPDRLDDLAALHTAGRFRFVNRLAAWIDVDDDGRITAAGYDGEGLMGFTVFTIGGRSMTVPGVAYPDIQHEPELTNDGARFVQTAGGRPGMPFPRTVNRPPYMQISAPTVWTTLALTIRSDGSATHDVVGATPFPRHWIYDDTGTLVKKSGLTDLRSWAGENYGERTPWGEHDRQAIITTVESALERTLSTLIMQGDTKPRIREIRCGATVTEEGAPADELYLILDGMLDVEVDGRTVAEIGPGAIVGERAVLEGGHRTSTLRATTPCRVAVASASQIDREALIELSKGHHSEDTPATDDPASERWSHLPAAGAD